MDTPSPDFQRWFFRVLPNETYAVLLRALLVISRKPFECVLEKKLASA